jgi:hypothetical protein
MALQIQSARTGSSHKACEGRGSRTGRGKGPRSSQAPRRLYSPGITAMLVPSVVKRPLIEVLAFSARNGIHRRNRHGSRRAIDSQQ